MGKTGWIEDLLRETTEKRWCVQMNCTTCGALDFRRALSANLNPEISVSYSGRWPTLSESDGYLVIDELKRLRPKSDSDRRNWDEAVMLLLFLTYSAVGGTTKMQNSLQESFAGEVLDRMIAHNDRVTASRRKREQFESPAAAAERRAAKKIEKQRRHAERLEQQRLRSIAYRASRPGSD